MVQHSWQTIVILDPQADLFKIASLIWPHSCVGSPNGSGSSASDPSEVQRQMPEASFFRPIWVALIDK